MKSGSNKFLQNVGTHVNTPFTWLKTVIFKRKKKCLWQFVISYEWKRMTWRSVPVWKGKLTKYKQYLFCNISRYTSVIIVFWLEHFLLCRNKCRAYLTALAYLAANNYKTRDQQRLYLLTANSFTRIRLCCTFIWHSGTLPLRNVFACD